MEEKELHFTKKKRHHVAPNCPCGEVNSPKNPFFSPFDDCDGQYGHCHKCDKTFMPESEPQEGVVYRAPEKKPQQFIQPEPVFDWIFPDTIIDPKSQGKLDHGIYTLTWYYRDVKGRLTSAKQMEYKIDDTGMHRVKDKHPRYPYMRDSGYYGCIFYERDLTTYPQAKVILLESEKSAALLRRKFKDHLQEFIYLAVGGANGLTDEKMQVLKQRHVLICYDCDNGERQEDGSVKGPKGREAADAVGVKLSAICQAEVVDIYPDRNDGTDLGDVYREIDIEYLRQLRGKQVVDEKLIQHLKQLNRKDKLISEKDYDSLAEEHVIHPDKIRTIERQIQKNFSAERGIESGPLIKRIELWLSERYDFRRNTVDNKVYVKKKDDQSWAVCNDADLWREIHYDIAAFGNEKKILKYDIETILRTKFVQDWKYVNGQWEDISINHVDKIKILWDQTLILEKPDEDPPLIYIDHTPVCTPGNHTLLIGRKKSRKSLLVTHLLHLFLKERHLADQVAVFDTEQGKLHVWKGRERIYRMSNQLVPFFWLRGKSPVERREFISQSVDNWNLRSTTPLKIIVIDGIRDCMSNINDPDETTEVIVWLEGLTIRHNLSIINILHLNKTDNNARGHIGSELLNKAECTIEVQLDEKSGHSVVKCESSREKPFEPFMFTHGATGLPEMVGVAMGNNDRARDEKAKLLDSVFEGEILKYGDLKDAIKTNFKIGENKAKQLIADFVRDGWILKSGPARSKDTSYKLMVQPNIKIDDQDLKPEPSGLNQFVTTAELPF
jgi:hypothetical protein